MTAIVTPLCWAAALIALAFANYFGLIADKNAAILFTVIPAVWIAAGGLGRCNQRGAKA
jgi:hypothetical protein